VISLLAHQGGWDEILLVLGPIMLIAGLLWLAKNRVERNIAAPPSETTPSETTPSEPEPADQAPQD
jgi:hypothetical protein